MIMDASPIQLTLCTIGLALAALVFIYLAARLSAWGVARSWYEFFNNRKKEEKDDQRKDNSAG